RALVKHRRLLRAPICFWIIPWRGDLPASQLVVEHRRPFRRIASRPATVPTAWEQREGYNARLNASRRLPQRAPADSPAVLRKNQRWRRCAIDAGDRCRRAIYARIPGTQPVSVASAPRSILVDENTYWLLLDHPIAWKHAAQLR